MLNRGVLGRARSNWTRDRSCTEYREDAISAMMRSRRSLTEGNFERSSGSESESADARDVGQQQILKSAVVRDI